MNKHLIKAELRITGDDIIPEMITDEMGITPTRTITKGDNIRRTSEKYDYSAWEYCFNEEEGYDLDAIEMKIVLMFNDKKHIFNVLKSEYKNVSFTISFVVWISEGSLPGIFLSYNFIKFASDIYAEIDVDQYLNY